MNRRVLVTGAGSGIGAACVDRSLAAGHDVTAVDLERGTMAGREHQLAAVHELDVSAAAAVRDISAIDEVDIVVQSAGTVGPNMPLTEVPLAEFERTMAVNLTGVFNVVQAAVPAMVQRGWGRVVH